jgi:hypothetical protein
MATSLRSTRSPLIWLAGPARESATQKYGGIVREAILDFKDLDPNGGFPRAP